jgi:hypothetical protein
MEIEVIGLILAFGLSFIINVLQYFERRSILRLEKEKLRLEREKWEAEQEWKKNHSETIVAKAYSS